MDSQSFQWHYKAQYIRAIDGDTVEVLVDLGFKIARIMKFRLLGINSPEMVGADKAAGQAAKDHLDSLLRSGDLIVHSHKDKADKYGDRWLGTFLVVQPDGTLLNANTQMIADGHAVPYMV